jgi:hypothetical protein
MSRGIVDQNVSADRPVPSALLSGGVVRSDDLTCASTTGRGLWLYPMSGSLDRNVRMKWISSE